MSLFLGARFTGIALRIAFTVGFRGLAVLGEGVTFFGAVEANGACGFSVTVIGLWFTTL